MKKFLLLISGICGAVAWLAVQGTKRNRPVEELAQNLERAWADHHTVV